MKNYQQTPKQRKQFKLARTQDKIRSERYTPKIVASQRIYDWYYSAGLMGLPPVGRMHVLIDTTHTVR